MTDPVTSDTGTAADHGPLRTLYDYRGEVSLVGIIGVIVLYMYIETFSMLPGSRRVARFVMYLTFGTIVLILLEWATERRVKDVLFGALGRVVPTRAVNVGLTDTTDTMEELDIDLQQDVNLYEIEMKATVPILAWMAGYLVGIVFVGFFTTTTLFVVGYVYVNWERADRQRRLVAGAVAAAVTDLLAYLLFVRFLLVYELYDFGFLP